MSLNRRSFIRYASLAAAGNIAGFRPFGAINALAQSSPSYKALVCIFMYGGNDSNNTLVPFDTSANGTNGYTAYSGIRGPLSIGQSTLLPLGAGANGNYGLHPSLVNVQSLFNSGNLAFVSNVGTLLQPLTQAQYKAGGAQTPSNLFSHPDQQLEWQNAAQNATSPIGWAGRIADSFGPSFNPSAQIPLITSVFGDTLFCNGASTTPVAVAPGNLQGGVCSEGNGCSGRIATAQQLLTFNSGLSLVQADNAITTNAYTYMNILANAVQSVTPLTTVFPTYENSLGQQLQQIAQIIQVRQALGINRQIFFAGLENFDTHSGQLTTQAGLLSQLDGAIGAFYQATQELGLANQITTFTMSDFNRAMQPNSNTGSDHAWGGHLFVMGGAVNGGQIYGTFPTLALAGPNDSGVNGRWIPTISSSQYAATLANWFGVPSSGLASIFPYLGNFTTTHLGFV
ncbi:MAG TPA: DUF1501 domain-containing protein [Silvibacterium sp.]|nr:DUF1501 domain-containing protein [Silvibacterium sp.]